MKTSKKIILTIAGLFIALLLISLAILRKDLQEMLLEADLKNKYKTVAVGDFEALDFSANWKVKIIQGKECKLELSMKEDSTLKPGLENSNGTLYFKPDTTSGKGNSGSMVARVTLPSLKTIKATSGTKILLENFKSDSLTIVLHGGTFTGKNNKFKHLSFKASGEAQLEFTDTQE
jgi:hypothetical protein